MDDPKQTWLDALFLKLFASGNPLTHKDNNTGISWTENPKALKRYQAKRKIRNRMARESRRANRA